LTVSVDGIAFWVKVAGDPKAYARILRDTDALRVTDISRGALPAGSGALILAEGLRAATLASGQRLIFSGITNAETLAHCESDLIAADSLLGRLGARALRQIGLEPVAYQFELVRGKLDLQIVVR
jgi:hypothetical protein